MVSTAVALAGDFFFGAAFFVLFLLAAFLVLFVVMVLVLVLGLLAERSANDGHSYLESG